MLEQLLKQSELHEYDVLRAKEFVDVVDELEPVRLGSPLEPVKFAVFEDLGFKHFAAFVLHAVYGGVDVFQLNFCVY